MAEYSAIADSLAAYVYSMRKHTPSIPVSGRLDRFNNWVHQSGIIIQDPKTAAWAYQQMLILFDVPFGLLRSAIQYDHLAVDF